MTTLKEKSIKVDFDGGYYNWERRDRKIEKDVTGRAGISREAIKARKNIFLGNDQTLHSLRQVVQYARSQSESLTLPWEPSRRLLLNINFLPHQKAMMESRNALDTLFERLDEEWDDMISSAKANLGPLADPDIYPTLEDVKARTYIRTTFYPHADESDVRLDIDEGTLTEIRQEVVANQQRLFSDAIFNTWERIYKIVEKGYWNLTKSLGEDAGRFRSEWFGNMADLVPALKGLNLAEDPRLDDMADRLGNFVADFDKDRLKQSWHHRSRAKKDMVTIYNDMSAIFGPMAKERGEGGV